MGGSLNTYPRTLSLRLHSAAAVHRWAQFSLVRCRTGAARERTTSAAVVRIRPRAPSLSVPFLKLFAAMTDERAADRDLDWYQSHWDTLMEVLSVSDPEAVVDEVRRLQERAETMTRQHEALAEAGVEDPERLLQMLDNMTDQLEELYAERDQRGEPRFERTAEAEEPSDNG